MEKTRIDYKCPDCDLIDHDENHFCLCPCRNIKLAKQYREDGIDLWAKPNHVNVYANDEEDFVEKSLNTRRPCTVWMRGDMCQKKIDDICKRRGVYFIKTNIDGAQGTICLPRNPSSDRELDSKNLQTK